MAQTISILLLVLAVDLARGLLNANVTTRSNDTTSQPAAKTAPAKASTKKSGGIKSVEGKPGEMISIPDAKDRGRRDPVKIEGMSQVAQQIVGQQTGHNVNIQQVNQVFDNTQTKVISCCSNCQDTCGKGPQLHSITIKWWDTQCNVCTGPGITNNPKPELGKDKVMTAGIMINGLKFVFGVYSTQTEIFWSQQDNNVWQQWQPVNILEIDTYLPFSIIQWYRELYDKTKQKDKVPMWGFLKDGMIKGYGVPQQLPYCINRLFLHFLTKLTVEKTAGQFKLPEFFEIIWEEERFTDLPQNIQLWMYPYFLPHQQRLDVFKVVNKDGVWMVVETTAIEGFQTKPVEFVPGITTVTIKVEVPTNFEVVIPGLPEIGVTVPIGPGPGPGPGPVGPGMCECRRQCSCTEPNALQVSTNKNRLRRSVNGQDKSYIEFTDICVGHWKERDCKRAYKKYLKRGKNKKSQIWDTEQN